MFFLIFSPVLAFNSFNISLWDSTRKPLISEVISSFKEALEFPKGFFNSGGFWSWWTRNAYVLIRETDFLLLLVKLDFHLHFRCFHVGCSFSFGFLWSTLWLKRLCLNFYSELYFQQSWELNQKNRNIAVQLNSTDEKTESLNLQNASYLYPPSIIWSQLYS